METKTEVLPFTFCNNLNSTFCSLGYLKVFFKKKLNLPENFLQFFRQFLKNLEKFNQISFNETEKSASDVASFAVRVILKFT